MKLEVNNLLFDEDNEDCILMTSYTQGHRFAFIQALDLGMPSSRLNPPHKARYWGVWDESDRKGSALRILQSGAQWPKLPE